jgi:hypothetical protein
VFSAEVSVMMQCIASAAMAFPRPPARPPARPLARWHRASCAHTTANAQPHPPAQPLLPCCPQAVTKVYGALKGDGFKQRAVSTTHIHTR